MINEAKDINIISPYTNTKHVLSDLGKTVLVITTVDSNRKDYYGFKYSRIGYSTASNVKYKGLLKGQGNSLELLERSSWLVCEVLESEIKQEYDYLGRFLHATFSRCDVIYIGDKATALNLIKKQYPNDKLNLDDNNSAVINSNPLRLSNLTCNDFCKHLLSKISSIEFF